MVQIHGFAVEQWMDRHEIIAKYNLADTCCASVSLNDLLNFGRQETALVDFAQKQVYGAIRGSTALRSNIANLYSPDHSNRVEPVLPGHVLVTNGAIQANFLVLYTIVGPGGHVICHYPTHQQLYSVPESLRAEAMIKPNTKVIIINNPQNPTGAILHRHFLQELVNIARQRDIIIHCDEVYRPLFHSLGPGEHEPPTSILDFSYEKVITTGSMSKAFSLASIRLGWIVSRSTSIIEACASSRDYTLISVGQIDNRVAAHTLSKPHVNNLLKRNVQLARQNMDAIDAFASEFKWAVSWTRPLAGTTAFVKFVNRDGRPINDVVFCQRLQEQVEVMLVPGSGWFGGGIDFRGYVRIGYVQEPQTLLNGLQALRQFMRNDYEKLPVA